MDLKTMYYLMGTALIIGLIFIIVALFCYHLSCKYAEKEDEKSNLYKIAEHLKGISEDIFIIQDHITQLEARKMGKITKDEVLDEQLERLK